MSSFTNYLEDAVLNHVFRNVALSSPATVYAALFSVAPGEAGGGTELVGNGYTRKAITFGAPSSGQVANSVAVDFDPVTGSSWTVVGVAIFDASSNGNMLAYKAIGSQTINVGDQARFAIGALTVSLD